MRKVLPVFVLVFLLFFPFVTSSVFADFDKTYQTYISQYDEYRVSLTNFLTSKNRYLTYKTLTAQTEALTATKVFLEDRDQTLINFMTMILEKNPSESFKKLISDEIVFFSDHKKLVTAVASLEDSVQVSETFTNRFPTTEVLLRQTIANILLSKVKSFDEQIVDLMARFEEKINFLKSQGKDVSTLERWLLETKNKQLLAHEKLTTAQLMADQFQTNNNPAKISEDFRKVQVLIFEANQYLKESTAYLREIKEELKYGNY